MHPDAAINDFAGPLSQSSRVPARRVLVTGGAGRIATDFARAHASVYDLTLLDLPGSFSEYHRELGTLVEADLSRLEEIAQHFSGIDTVVHLGGERRPDALWRTLLSANVIGTYNVVAAALGAGCRRVVYASSVHAVSGHPPSLGARETDPVRAGDLYGATKCWGEAVGAAAAAEGLSFIALRIGAYEEPEVLSHPQAGWMLRDYCAPRDLIRLMTEVIEADDLGYEVFNAVSGGILARLPMDKSARMLGVVPEYDAAVLTPSLWQAFDEIDIRDKAFPSGFRAEVDAMRREGQP